jgi:hypothetical protein
VDPVFSSEDENDNVGDNGVDCDNDSDNEVKKRAAVASRRKKSAPVKTAANNKQELANVAAS